MPLSTVVHLRERFGTKIFFVFAVFITVVSCCFTVLLIRHETQSLTEGLIAQGELFVQLLAHSSRLGVFSENQDLLDDNIQGVIQNREVVEAAVFNGEGKLLRKSRRLSSRTNQSSERDIQKEILSGLKRKSSSLRLERVNEFEFWAPVLSAVSFASEEELLLGRPEKIESYRTIGFAKIIIDKSILHQRLRRTLVESVLVALSFFGMGCLIAYFVARQITKPLKGLTEGVHAIGIGGSAEPIFVQTRDEIGKLATAFNNMASSLRTREAEKKQLEEQLLHAQKMEAIGTLAGGIAHDFNNILQAIIGYGSLLKMKAANNSALKHYVDLILSAAERAAQLTRGLLAFSRKQVINPRPSDLNELVKSIQKFLRHVIGEDIEVNANLAEGRLIIMIDPSQLDQVLMNLATNARDAMPKGGTFTLSTDSVELGEEFFKAFSEPRPGVYAMISCADTGHGMDERTKARIFDPFYTTKEVGKGTGLGLSTVYGIVKQHDGFIQVDTAVGAGTTFRIYFPLVDAKPDGLNRRDLEEKEVSGTETVLVAEDDWAVRKLIRSILEEFGYTVIEASNGSEAVEQFADHREQIDLMLFDMVLPEMSGKQAFHEIASVEPGVPVIFISGYPEEQIGSHMSEPQPIVAKPISPADLLTKVRQTLDE
jgi:signal transduction histidine kinase